MHIIYRNVYTYTYINYSFIYLFIYIYLLKSIYKNVLQHLQWIVFPGAKPAQDEKNTMIFIFLNKNSLISKYARPNAQNDKSTI